MRKIFEFIVITGACILMMCAPVSAEINYNLIWNWALQPTNVQNNLVMQHTSIYVMDKLPWESPDLAQTWAYTTMNVSNGRVQSIDMYIKTGYESALTHEVGHGISNYAQIPYWWCFQPSFVQIYEQERFNNVLMAQGFYDIREYFACAYDLFIRYPELLKQTNPLTYNYLQVVMCYT